MSRGILYSLIARGFFILGAYVIHVYAGRKLGPSVYGTFGVMLSILAISYLFLSNGIRQAVSRSIAVHPHNAKKIFHNGLFIQSISAVCIVFVISGFSGEIASFFRDASLTSPLKYLGAVIFFQAISTSFVIYFVRYFAVDVPQAFLTAPDILPPSGGLSENPLFSIIALNDHHYRVCVYFQNR